MNLHGYTEKRKSREAVSMPVEDVVRLGIDPWRLDIFDRNPIESTLDGKKLFFSRLQNCVFSYRANDNLRHFICLHDGTDTMCLSGELDEMVHISTITSYNFCDLKPSQRSYTEHLQEYLTEYSNHRSESRFTALPRRSSLMEVRGNTLTLGDHKQIFRQPGYCGEMLEQRQAPWKFPDWVNWVFEFANGCQPVIFGEEFTRLFATPLRVVGVKVAVPESLLGTVAARACQLKEIENPMIIPASICSFNYRGHRYIFTPRSVMEEEKSEPSRYSSDLIVSGGPNSIKGPRVSLFDIARTQTRPMTWDALWETREDGTLRRPYALRQCGFGINSCWTGD